MRRFSPFQEIHVAGNGVAVASFSVLSPARAKTTTTDVAVGQRYKKLDAIATVWEVEACLPDGGAIPHVRLRSVADPWVTRLISVSALRNHRFYQLVPSAPTPGPSPNES